MKTHLRSLAVVAGLLLAAAPACTQIVGLGGTYSPAVDAPCMSTADCAWGVCNGTPGWCTSECTADSDCPAGYCIDASNDLWVCFPACASDDDCTAYGIDALSCKPATTAGGITAGVCSR